MKTHFSKWKRALSMSFHLVLFSVCLIFILSACSSNQNVKNTPASRVVEFSLAKGIKEVNNQDVLLTPTDEFTTKDNAAIIHVKLADIYGPHKAQWKWYNPDGNLYYKTKKYNIGPSKGYFVDEASSWHKISINGEKAALHPGQWSVELYFDDKMLISRQFNIKRSRYDITYDVDNNIPQTYMENPDAVAIIIGNRNYKHKDIPSVDYAHHDADIIKQYVINTLGYRQSNIIFEKDVSKSRLEALFGIVGNHKGELYDFIKPNRSDVFVYYSGHGAPDLGNMKRYIVPSDCDPERVALNGYSLDLLYENLSKLEARKITVVIEACFSGATNSGLNLTKSASPALIKVDTSMPFMANTSVLASSEGNQVSSWHDEMKHGLFTYFFLMAIGGAADLDMNKEITFQEIHAYMSDRSEGVPYWAKRFHGGRTQTPMLYSNQKEDVFVAY